jgi:hypothetical protein
MSPSPPQNRLDPMEMGGEGRGWPKNGQVLRGSQLGDLEKTWAYGGGREHSGGLRPKPGVKGVRESTSGDFEKIWVIRGRGAVPRGRF